MTDSSEQSKKVVPLPPGLSSGVTVYLHPSTFDQMTHQASDLMPNCRFLRVWKSGRSQEIAINKQESETGQIAGGVGQEYEGCVSQERPEKGMVYRVKSLRLGTPDEGVGLIAIDEIQRQELGLHAGDTVNFSKFPSEKCSHFVKTLTLEGFLSAEQVSDLKLFSDSRNFSPSSRVSSYESSTLFEGFDLEKVKHAISMYFLVNLIDNFFTVGQVVPIDLATGRKPILIKIVEITIHRLYKPQVRSSERSDGLDKPQVKSSERSDGLGKLQVKSSERSDGLGKLQVKSSERSNGLGKPRTDDHNSPVLEPCMFYSGSHLDTDRIFLEDNLCAPRGGNPFQDYGGDLHSSDILRSVGQSTRIAEEIVRQSQNNHRYEGIAFRTNRDNVVQEKEKFLTSTGELQQPLQSPGGNQPKKGLSGHNLLESLFKGRLNDQNDTESNHVSFVSLSGELSNRLAEQFGNSQSVDASNGIRPERPVTVDSEHVKTTIREGWNWESMKIGGLRREFEEIFRRAFASRLIPEAERLGTGHVRGVILHGPPGTGKTLMARQISQMVTGREPRIVNGPELLSKYVGEAEAKLRNLFLAAEQEFRARGTESSLHIFIFDEIDSCCARRSSDSDASASESRLVSQLLTKMDGIHQLPNILIFGLTNRLDVIDEALLRPGRFEVQVEIGIPGRAGRLEILEIHTQTARNLRRFDPDLEEMADETVGFTGAQLEGLIKSMASYGENRKFDPVTLKLLPGEVRITQDDYRRALEECKIGKKSERTAAQKRIPAGFQISNDPEVLDLQSAIRLRQNERTAGEIVREQREHQSLLIYGTCKQKNSATAAKIALESGYSSIRIIDFGVLFGLTSEQKCSVLRREYKNNPEEATVYIFDDLDLIFGSEATVFQEFLRNPIVPGSAGQRLIIGTAIQKDAWSGLFSKEFLASS